MGRKIDMKKIEDVTKCQVTFSKRRSSLIKKANEVAICCDVDVAFVAFSPSGRVSKFCNQRRIEDVLNHYVNLPVDKRLHHITNVQEKMEKLKQLNHIKGDASKLQYLNKQIENLELQIKKSGLELQILETDLRDYEVDPEQEPSLHQLSWCERNLNHSLESVLTKKNTLSGTLNTQPNIQVDQMEMEVPFSSNVKENEKVSTAAENTSTGQILMQFDPWISPYSARVRENLYQGLLTKYTANENPGPSNIPSFSIPCNFPILDSQTGIALTSDAQISAPLFPIEQSLVDQTLVNFHDQNNVAAWNNVSLVNSSDAIFHMSTQSLCNIQAPRYTSVTTITTKDISTEMPQSLYDEMGIGFQSSNSNLSQFNNMEGQDQLGQHTMAHNNTFNNGNPTNGDEDSSKMNPNGIHENAQTTIFENLLPQGNLGDNTLWTSKMQKSSLWEWEDLLLDDNFNLEDN